MNGKFTNLLLKSDSQIKNVFSRNYLKVLLLEFIFLSRNPSSIRLDVSYTLLVKLFCDEPLVRLSPLFR